MHRTKRWLPGWNSVVRMVAWPVFAASPTSPTPPSWRDLPPCARDGSPESVLYAFSSMVASETLNHLQSRNDGLTNDEVHARRELVGPNILSSQKPPSWFLLLISTIPNPFNLLLICLAIINAAIPPPNWKGFIVLTVMVVISSAVRFWQEYRSTMAVFRLQSSVVSKFKTRRPPPEPQRLADKTHATSEAEVRGTDLVPGDVVLLSPGTVVPADCLILESTFLRISQSAWTGETEPVLKTALTEDGKDNVALFDLVNVAFMGTNVVSGNAVALVLRTGDDLLIAEMGKELEKRRKVNAFQKGIRNVTWLLIGFMVIMVPIVLCISGRTTGDWGNAALFSISVAVGLIPEMLPAIVNANLARGAYLLSKKKAIVKRLDSVQNMGAMSVLCSDKTGTLTNDKITLHQHLDCFGNTNLQVLKLATIEASVQGGNGNNMDMAILDFRLADGTPVGIAQYEKVATIPFDFERRRSACIIRGMTGLNVFICKGALEEVLTLCSSLRNEESQVVPLDETTRQSLVEQAKVMSVDGFRVLLVATKHLTVVELEDETRISPLESQMTLEGMLSFVDPPKDDAKEAIAQLRSLGVEVKVLTGDNLAVALNVCRAIDLVRRDDALDSDDVQAITGPEIDQLQSIDDLDATVNKCKVFAKLTPRQKGQVVASLQRANQCVGMLGDGINDCVALRGSDVGISVDSGMGVAKDCADLILTEKGLDIIVDCVKIGRVTHGNTVKYIKMVASSNFGNVFSILSASAWLPFTPMTSLQILTQNLLYDVSQIAIPWDRVDTEYLQQPKRWNAFDLLRFVIVLGPTSSTIDITTFCLGWFFYGVKTVDDDDAVRLFQTHWFLQGLLTQTLIVHLLRTAKLPFIQSRASRPLAVSTGLIMAIGFVLPWIPTFQSALAFVRPVASFIGFLAVELLVYCAEVQIVKMVYIRIFGVWL